VYHDFQMRRCFSIFLILTFALGPLSALADGSGDANLPACCRRDGAHRCSMKMRRAAMRALDGSGRTTIGVPATCPAFPGLAAMYAAAPPALTATQASVQGTPQRGVAMVGRSKTASWSLIRAHAGRGPPVS
jgi:hypothetical protein